MLYSELSEEQRRQLIDVQQLFDAWRPVDRDMEMSPRLAWHTSKGKRYLYEKVQGNRKSLGRETPALARRKVENDARMKTLRARVRRLRARAEEMAPVNKAVGIARVPLIAARIIRELDREGLLGPHIIVAGTNALYAYEMAAGVFVGGRYTTTTDADLIWDNRHSLLLSATSVVRRDGLMSILQRVDPTFTADYGMIVRNDRGYIVDLIVPENEEIAIMRPVGDVEAQPIGNIEWLLTGPAFAQTVVGADGLPLRIVVPEPRTFALHKLWVSKQGSRNALKSVKDASHARIVCRLAQRNLGLSMNVKDMPWLPATLKKLLPELKRLARAEEEND
ncbi:MAG: hypothetical protein H7124_16155 [Phycisphaerales bacterium]|nr:hypothetical protein [Hyphomonadaceae bacterium]